MKKIDVAASVTPTLQAVPVEKEAVLDLKETIKRKNKEKLERLMKEELQIVSGIFQNFETPGLSLRLQVRKYPGHFFDQTLEDGKTYQVPLYIARHLNGIDVMAEACDGHIGTCSYPIHSYIMDKDGIPIVSTLKRKKRYGFQSTQFASSERAA